MKTQNIEQITNALQQLMYWSYVAFLKANKGFEIEDERNGYQSEQFTEDIRLNCGIEFLKATTIRYGSDYTLHYKMVWWLADLFANHKLPLMFTCEFPNQTGGDQDYIMEPSDIDYPIQYDINELEKLSEEDLLSILKVLQQQITLITIKYQ